MILLFIGIEFTEPDYLKFDNYLIESFKKKDISHKIFKGNTLNELEEVKKEMAHLLKYSHRTGELLKNIILKKFHQKKK